MCGALLKAGFRKSTGPGRLWNAVNKPLKQPANASAANSLSALSARKSAISGLPKMALGAISSAIRAAIDEIRAVRAGRQEVLAPAVIGGMSRSRFLKSVLQAPDKSTYRTCRQAAGPLLRTPANSGRQGLRNPDTSRPIRPLTRMAGDTRIWRTNGFDCYFL